jgi:hypothetical protein
MAIRSKDQDFAIPRPLFLKASHKPDFSDGVERESQIAYIAAEIKTNLDKTMFQEAAATANDLRLAVPNARYFLLCEWLDMTPITTSVTAIEKVIILRKAKRTGANIRSAFATAGGRRAAREDYIARLRAHPFSVDSFTHFLDEIAGTLGASDEEEDVVLGRGWF